MASRNQNNPPLNALAPETTNQKEAAAAPSEAQVIEFKKEVDALLIEDFNEQQVFADRKSYMHAKLEWMMTTLKRQRVCLKWFRENEGLLSYKSYAEKVKTHEDM